MADEVTKRGILNDWGLTHVRVKNVGTERTGASPFMALDLLCKGHWEGRVTRFYRHDLEELIWVLPWVILQFNGKERQSYQLQSWSTYDYDHCRINKNDFLARRGRQHAQTSWQGEWLMTLKLLGSIASRQAKFADLRAEEVLRMDQDSSSSLLTPPEPSATEHFSEFLNILESAYTLYPPLKDIITVLYPFK